MSPNGGRARLTRNIAGIVMDFDDVETLDLTTAGGSDTVTIDDLTGTDLKTAEADLGGADGQADTVVQNGTGGVDQLKVTRSGDATLVAGLKPTTIISGSEPANDTLRLNTLAGDDSVSVAPNLPITPVIDLGADS